MHITGTAQDFIDTLSEHTIEDVSDAVVVALAVEDNDTWRTWSWIDTAWEQLEEPLTHATPRLIVLVLEAMFRDHRVRDRAAALLEEASVFSTNVLGKDITAIAIAIQNPSERALAASRITDFVKRRVYTGNGTVMNASQLEHDSIANVLLAETL